MPRARQPRNVGKARQLRQQMSLPEVLIWQELRKQPGVKSRRQHPLGPYVLDFYCAAAKLCVEIDGIAHDMGSAPTRDVTRDEWLREQGVTVLRIPVREVLQAPHEVAEGIIRSCLR